MEKRRRCTKLLVVSAALLSMISLPAQGGAKWDAQVLEIITANRPRFNTEYDIDAVREEFSALLYSFNSLADELSLLIEFLGTGSPKVTVSAEQAVEDVEYLFSLLKFGYVGYQYFGGDERFQQARKEILEQLYGRASSKISVYALYDLIYSHLNFINDGHFYLANRPLQHAQTMSMDFRYDFLKDGNGYYTETNGVKEYLELVNGEKPDLWPALNSAGQIVYRVGKLGFESKNADGFELVELILSTNDSSRQDYAVLEQANSAGLSGEGYERFSLGGIPVVVLRSFPHASAMQDFVDDAHELKKESVFVIDLRSNQGGDTGALEPWIRILTGGSFEFPQYVTAGLRTKTVYELGRSSWHFVLEGLSSEALRPELFVSETGWTEISLGRPSGRTSNPVGMVVLIDSKTVSAGEHFVDLLRQMENVVFLGLNTAGAYLTGNPVSTFLPHSQLQVHFGTVLVMAVEPEGLVDREGIGFLPDFWVQPDAALDLAIKFIENYRVP